MGRSIRSSKEYYRPVGVIGLGFHGPPKVHLLAPFDLAPAKFISADMFNEIYFVGARLRQRVSVSQASVVVALLARRIIESPGANLAKASAPKCPACLCWSTFTVMIEHHC